MVIIVVGTITEGLGATVITSMVLILILASCERSLTNITLMVNNLVYTSVTQGKVTFVANTVRITVGTAGHFNATAVIAQMVTVKSFVTMNSNAYPAIVASVVAVKIQAQRQGGSTSVIAYVVTVIQCIVMRAYVS